MMIKIKYPNLSMPGLYSSIEQKFKTFSIGIEMMGRHPYMYNRAAWLEMRRLVDWLELQIQMLSYLMRKIIPYKIFDKG